MSQKTQITESSAIRDALRRLYLASVGAVSTVEEELEKLMDTLVEKGEKTEARMKKRIRRQIEERQEEAEKWAGDIETALDDRIQVVLTRLNLPKHTELQKLNERVEELSRKLEQK